MKTKDGKTITVGSDIEFALYHQTSYRYIPATSYNTKPTKDKPERVVREGTFLGTYHRDNIGVEIQPIQSEEPVTFQKNIAKLYEAVRQVYRERIDGELYAVPVQYYNKEMLSVHEAMEMGCDPDKCAYTGEDMEGPTAEDMGPFRAFSGHVHIGGLEDWAEDKLRVFVRWFDITVALRLSTLDTDRSDDADKRRKWYGQAGRYRLKPYGVECRVLSNGWVNHLIDHERNYADEHRSTSTTDTLFKGIEQALDLTEAGYEPEAFGNVELVREALEANDFDDIYEWEQGIMEQARTWGAILHDLQAE